MSGDNRIGTNAVSGVFRANAARPLASDGSAAMRAPTPVYAPAEQAPATRLLGMASQLAEQGPPVDMDRVATLKAALADGSYTADPDKIAGAMLSFFGKDR